MSADRSSVSSSSTNPKSPKLAVKFCTLVLVLRFLCRNGVIRDICAAADDAAPDAPDVGGLNVFAFKFSMYASFDMCLSSSNFVLKSLPKERSSGRAYAQTNTKKILAFLEFFLFVRFRFFSHFCVLSKENKQTEQSIPQPSRIRSWGIYKRYAHNTHAHVIMKPWIEPPESSSSLYTIKNATVPMVVLSVADKTNHHTTTRYSGCIASESPDVALTNSSSSKIDPYYSADRDGLVLVDITVKDGKID